jgi:exopolysaccharide biosynthesis polyprenyl glycosylphosphotransferase
MDKRVEILLLLGVDFTMINLAWICFFLFRVQTGWFDMLMMPDFWGPLVAIYAYWMIIFVFVGLYRSWFALSRLDEVSSLFKSTSLGALILFFLIFFDDSTHGVHSKTRMLIAIYWGMIFGFVTFGRLLLRALQRRLLINGIGRRRALVIGAAGNAIEISRELQTHRGLGLDVIGYLDVEHDVPPLSEARPLLGNRAEFTDVVTTHNIKEVIFALEHKHDDIVVDLLARGDSGDVGFKIVPDLYEILSGQARTSQLYGVPLIDINPSLMPAWEKTAKRILDLFIALIILLITSPIIAVTAIAIKLNSPGRVFYKQDRCGLNGRIFKIIKFRSMKQDAEKLTGPVWSQKNDPRVTAVGRFIRKVRLDEIPQMWNVLKGEMSLIGPRPERPFFVEKLAGEIPYYKRRLRVRPGVTGWAQVKHKYDESVEDVRMKLKYDLFYIENMSLRMDMKILFRTIFVVLFGKGHFE